MTKSTPRSASAVERVSAPETQNADVVGSSMVVVDASDAAAARFYQAHGFTRLPDSPRLILPLRAIGGLVGPQGRE